MGVANWHEQEQMEMASGLAASKNAAAEELEQGVGVGVEHQQCHGQAALPQQAPQRRSLEQVTAATRSNFKWIDDV